MSAESAFFSSSRRSMRSTNARSCGAAMPPTSASFDFVVRFDSLVAPVTSTISGLAVYVGGATIIDAPRAHQAHARFATDLRVFGVIVRRAAARNHPNRAARRSPQSTSPQRMQLGGVAARAVARGPGQAQVFGPERAHVER